jgi:hypothetical protein
MILAPGSLTGALHELSQGTINFLRKSQRTFDKFKEDPAGVA